MALFIVLSVFSGLKSFNLFFMNTADPDIKITASKGKSFFLKEDLQTLLKDDKITHFSKIIEEHVLLDYSNNQIASTIKGVDENYLNVTKMDSTIIIGEWFKKSQKHTVIMGNRVANKLRLPLYSFTENLKIHVPKPGKSQMNLNSLRTVNAQCSGIYELNDVDSEFVFTNIALAQELLGYDENQYSAIALKLKNNDKANRFATQLQKKLGATFKVQTRKQQNAITFKMLNMENLYSYLISSLIVIIALFNVIGAMIMMILDKRENLKTLFNIGFPIKKIRKIFTLQGILLSLFGMIVGLVLASIIVFIQLKFELITIRPGLAYPVEFHLSNILIVIATITSLGIIAAFIASSRITKKFIV